MHGQSEGPFYQRLSEVSLTYVLVHFLKRYEERLDVWIATHTTTHCWQGNKMTVSGRLLLIMSCSQRKRPDLGLLPAIERYDGGHFRVLRSDHWFFSSLI